MVFCGYSVIFKKKVIICAQTISCYRCNEILGCYRHNCSTAFLWHIGRLYIVWSLLYFPLNLYEMQLRGEDVMYGLLNYVRNFFLTGSYWQLWFLNGLWVSVFLTAVGIRAKISFKWLFLLALLPYTIQKWYILLHFIFAWMEALW